MNRTRPWYALTLVLLPLLPLSLAACSDRMGSRFDWKRMRSQPRYGAYAANPAFADGSAMRVPPAGTISREDVATGAPPPAVDLVRGADRYHVFCAVCHGERGDGVSIVASNMDPPRPPSLVESPARDLAADSLFVIITGGDGRMPSFASQLSVADRWQVIAYLWQLQKRDSVATTP